MMEHPLLTAFLTIIANLTLGASRGGEQNGCKERYPHFRYKVRWHLWFEAYMRAI
jgi:hypothetical protein